MHYSYLVVFVILIHFVVSEKLVTRLHAFEEVKSNVVKSVLNTAFVELNFPKLAEESYLIDPVGTWPNRVSCHLVTSLVRFYLQAECKAYNGLFGPQFWKEPFRTRHKAPARPQSSRVIALCGFLLAFRIKFHQTCNRIAWRFVRSCPYQQNWLARNCSQM